MCRRRRTYLSGAWKHALAGIQPRTAGILNLLDFAAPLPDDGAHAGVGDHELDGHCLAARNGRLVKGLVIDAADDEAERLGAREM